MCNYVHVFPGERINWNVLYEKIDKNWELPMKFKWQLLRVDELYRKFSDI